MRIVCLANGIHRSRYHCYSLNTCVTYDITHLFHVHIYVQIPSRSALLKYLKVLLIVH